jgi:hypothetical protein
MPCAKRTDRSAYMRRWRASAKGQALSNAAAKAYRASGKARANERARRKGARRFVILLKEKAAQCRRSGAPFDLTLEDLGPCQACDCCGRAFDNSKRATAASLDRLRPSVGYVRGNVFVLCWTCNRRKQDSTAADLEAIAAWMRSKGAT